jgi:hypothetical protein
MESEKTVNFNWPNSTESISVAELSGEDSPLERERAPEAALQSDGVNGN